MSKVSSRVRKNLFTYEKSFRTLLGLDQLERNGGPPVFRMIRADATAQVFNQVQMNLAVSDRFHPHGPSKQPVFERTLDGCHLQ